MQFLFNLIFGNRSVCYPTDTDFSKTDCYNIFFIDLYNFLRQPRILTVQNNLTGLF